MPGGGPARTRQPVGRPRSMFERVRVVPKALPQKKMKPITGLLWIFIYSMAVSLSFDRHSYGALFDFHREISDDKAGYMVYLPAAFCYRFEARAFPQGIDVKAGSGFQLHLATNKVETKYPYGVALLQAPFWGVAQGLSADKSGFSAASHTAIDVAGASYLVLGLWLLFSTLRRHFSWLAVVLTLIWLTLGTNLWYYGVVEIGMSHVYSFFAFALLLRLLGRAHIPDWGRRAGLGWEVVGIAATLGLISILRPLNLLLALPLLLWPAQAAGQWRAQVRGLLRWRHAGVLLAAVAICWVPQLLYYNYARGSYLVYSYGQEGFPYVFSPRLAEVWFAPNNGAFLYNPLLLLVLLPGSWLLARRAGWWSGLAGLTWLVASYLYAAWWAYSLGCGYAGRGFVELYPVLAWPLAALTENLLTYRRWAVASLCILLVVYNMRVSFNFDRCFYGKGDWDWTAYRALLHRKQ